MTTIRARLDGQTEVVEASGATLPHAVRAAVRKLGLGSGRTVSREQVGAFNWTWNWSGKTIHVALLPNRQSLTNAHRGRQMVTITLSDEARTKLDALSERHDWNRSATVEALILASG